MSRIFYYMVLESTTLCKLKKKNFTCYLNVKFESIFSQMSIFEIGSHNFSKSYEPIFFKFCTLLLYNIFYCLNEGFFFSILSNFSRPYRVQILLKNGTFGSQLRQKCKFWFFFLRSNTNYKPLLTENFWFINFRWICHELSCFRRENFFLKGHRRWGPNNWIFKIF